ncbi:MAG: YeeE/YedE family protein [Maritimibacter sp.]
MFESFGFETLTAPQAAVYFALVLGICFGVLAQRTAFCFRRAVVAGPDRRQAAGVWALALAVAVMGTQALVAAGLISFVDHRLLAGDVPVLGIVLGGLMFGAGMVLTRGCISRLTVLGGGGNLRALSVVIVFAVVAHATLKGVLAPLRVALGDLTVGFGAAVDLASLPGGGLVWGAVISLIALVVALRSGASIQLLSGAALVGLLVPLGWLGTGYILYDDFDPVALESLSFTAPMSEALFYIIASSAVPAGFGTGLVGGTLLGALAASLAFKSFKWQSFSSPTETGRYTGGAVLMGIGGVLAGGCTLGAGLAGIPTLSLAAIIALVAIGAGGWATDRALNGKAVGAARTA